MNSSQTSGTSEPSPPPEASKAERMKGLGKPANLVLGGLAVCALAALFWPHGSGTFKEPGGFLIDAHGRPAKLGSMLAPVSLVHFWATWCPPCLQEAPAIQRLAHDYAGKKDFALVMVAVQDTEQKVRGLLGPGADMVLFDPNWEVANRYGTNQLPETYLVVHGEVVQKFVGETNWDNPKVRAKLDSYLGASPPATAALRSP
jgi:thiol-disulfide isomerase/thioredoxin